MKLKELRLKNGLLQDQIAEVLQIKKNTYSNYEIEKTQAPIEIYKKLAKYYNVSLDYLLGYTDKKETNSEFTLQEEELIDMFRDLSDLNKEIILRNFYILLGPDKRKNYDSLKYINL